MRACRIEVGVGIGIGVDDATSDDKVVEFFAISWVGVKRGND